MQALVLAAIRFYRAHLSHRKGYHCAWGRAAGRDTCSGVGLRAFRRAGVRRGWALMQRQFDRCTLASTASTHSGRYRRLRPLAAQRGDCDCGGPDLDCADGCGDHRGGRCRPPACGWNLLEFADCCSIDCGSGHRQDRAQRARERARQREEARARRRTPHG